MSQLLPLSSQLHKEIEAYRAKYKQFTGDDLPQDALKGVSLEEVICYKKNWISSLSDIFQSVLNVADLLEEQLEAINEKLIIAGGGKKYGQIIFMAGAGGSGKGFAIKNMLDSSSYKVIDVDHWKTLYLKLNDMTNRYPELKNINLKNPADTEKIHFFVKDKKIKEKTYDLLFGSARNKETLPNVIFDMVGKSTKDFTDIIPYLVGAGYQPENIHLVWVFAPYKDAARDNQKRSRTVPENILKDAHANVPKVITGFIQNGLPRGMDGDFFVINASRQHTKFYESKVLQDFQYVRIKRAGKKIDPQSKVLETLRGWIEANAPK